MRILTSLQRNSILAAGLVLLAGATGLLGQTAQAPAITVPADSLFFAHQVGAALPAGQTIRVFTTPASLPFTATAATTGGGGWLFINGLTQFTGNSAANGQDITISVSPAGLPPNAAPYTGSVTIASGTTVRVINVLMNVLLTPQLVVTPSSVPLQVVEAQKTIQIPITVNSTGAQQGFTATVDAFPATNWLTVAPNPAATAATPNVNLIINTANIPQTVALATGAVRFSVQGTTQTVTLPVTVQVTPAGTIQVSPAIVTFLYQPGFAVPGPKPVSVTSSTGTPLAYSAAISSAPNYFTLSGNGVPSTSTTLTGLATPNGFFLHPNVSALPANPPAGNYDTTVVVTSSTASTQNVTARITVTNQNLLTSGVDFVNFTYTLGGADLISQNISISSTSAQQSFSATAVFDAGMPAFFTLPNNGPFTPTTITVAPDMSVVRNLAAGTYTGKVRLVGQQSAATPLEIPVTLTVSGSAQLTVDTFQPPAFEGAIGQSQGARTVIVRSTDPSVVQTFSVTRDYGTGPQGWLVVDPLQGTTGTSTATLTYNVNANAITTAGNYTATLIITPLNVPNPVPIRLNIRYNVSGSTSISATPARLDLTQTGTTPPAVQSIQLSSATQNLSYIPSVAASGTDPVFVRVVNTAFPIPGALQLAFDTTSLTPRTEPYLNNVTLVPNQGGLTPVVIPVRLTVTAPSLLSVAPASLTFAFTTGAAAPAAQTLNVTATGGPIAFSVATTTQQGAGWLSVNPPGSTTNAAGGAAVPLSVSVNPAGLAAGTYNGTVTLTPTSGGGSPVVVNVVFTITAPNPPNGLQVSNTASGISRGISPGEFITIKGRNMAPATGLSFTLVNNVVPTTLGEVRVLFDSVPAPLIYVGPSGDRTSDQINAIVPYGTSGRTTTNVVVEYRGVASQAIPLTVRETEPGIFTTNFTGSGPASLRNQDSSVNTQANPAVAGTIIQIFGTGEGLFSPLPGDGRVVPGTLPFPTLLNPVQVRINGRTARILYSGPAPTLLAGVFQVNAEIPADLAVSATTEASLEVQIGATSSQPGATFWVRGRP